MTPKTFYGEKSWDKAIASAKRPTILILSNGSHWAGEQPDTVDQLLLFLQSNPLDVERWGKRVRDYATKNPCQGVPGVVKGRNTWVNGPRMFPVDGFFHFHGNFLHVSNVFSIYTNDAETIRRLKTAIKGNLVRGGKQP